MGASAFGQLLYDIYSGLCAVRDSRLGSSANAMYPGASCFELKAAEGGEKRDLCTLPSLSDSLAQIAINR